MSPFQPLAALCSSAAPAASVEPAVISRAYQPMRVVMSVLLTPAAVTRIRTSSGPGVGTGASVTYCSLSSSPYPVR